MGRNPEVAALVRQPERTVLAEETRRRPHRLTADRLGRSRLRDRACELEQRLEVVGLASLGLVEARVLEGYRSVPGEHLEQPDVVLVELVDAELRDHDHADRTGAVAERYGDERLLDRVRAGNHHRVLALEGVADELRLQCRSRAAGDVLAELVARVVVDLAVTPDNGAASGGLHLPVALA